MLQLVSTLIGYEVESSDGSIGTVRDILFDDVTWKMRWLAIDTGDWITRRHVLIHPSAIGLVDKGGKFLQVKIARNLINGAPALKKDQAVTMQFEASLYAYFDVEPEWNSTIFGERAAPEASASHDCDPHLCSFKATHGFHNEARDGSIGHMDDVVIETLDWLIHYLVVTTANWGTGARVLISPYAVEHISAAEKNIRLNLTQEQVTSSPHWDPHVLIDDSYLALIHAHYDWPAHQPIK